MVSSKENRQWLLATMSTVVAGLILALLLGIFNVGERLSRLEAKVESIEKHMIPQNAGKEK